MHSGHARQIYLHESNDFKQWLKVKGLIWPNDDPIRQENISSLYMRELLEGKDVPGWTPMES